MVLVYNVHFSLPSADVHKCSLNDLICPQSFCVLLQHCLTQTAISMEMVLLGISKENRYMTKHTAQTLETSAAGFT